MKETKQETIDSLRLNLRLINDIRVEMSVNGNYDDKKTIWQLAKFLNFALTDALYIIANE